MAKVELFDTDLQTTSALFKALGHPARLAILKYLSEIKVCISGDISNELPLSRTTVNQHLKELKDQGLIKGEIEGAKTNYCLNPHRIKELKEVLDQFLCDIDCSCNLNCD